MEMRGYEKDWSIRLYIRSLEVFADYYASLKSIYMIHVFILLAD